MERNGKLLSQSVGNKNAFKRIYRLNDEQKAEWEAILDSYQRRI